MVLHSRPGVARVSCFDRATTRSSGRVITPGSAALLLAGGLSRRMGVDKASLEYESVTLLERLATAATTVCDIVIILTRPEQTVASMPTEVIRIDDPPDALGLGPLSAVHRGLLAARDRGATVACLGACDMPWLDERHFAFVLEHLHRGAAAAVLPQGPEAQRHPLAGALRVAPALLHTANLLQHDRRSLLALYEALAAEPLQVGRLPEPRAVVGCNTPEEWRAFLQHRTI